MKLLLAIDGSRASLDAVQWVVALVQAGLKANVVLANVQEPASLYEMVVAHDPEVIDKASTDAARHILQPAQALLDAAGVSYSTTVAHGEPSHTLADILEDEGCEMVVLGRGEDALGSVAAELLALSSVPVLVVAPAVEGEGPSGQNATCSPTET
ncbi:UspA domain protein [Candidatus Symbiobacter mobilis CR]|uniref:UspA domain protein n=2 Tax=Candidatus Symbiobacter TaxID=1436289 RepID=U5N4M1_9BURK|nr:UspA domain protein [Candidatus Symbiobacter mobilis CR]